MSQPEASPAPKASPHRYTPLLRAFGELAPREAKLPDDEPEQPLTARGAALLLAHLIVEQGASKVAKMRPDEASAWAVAFRARYMQAWAAIRHEDPMGFQHALEIMRVLHDTVGGYQMAMDELLRPPKPGKGE